MTGGERWARELLAELRSARFTPRAWVVFLRRSFLRARECRRERPYEHRQALLLGAAGLAAWAGAVAGGRPALALSGATWWFLVVAMLDWHLGMLERPDGSPVVGLGLANLLCLLRAGAVPALLALEGGALAALFLAAGLSDGVDGWIARARDEATRLGFWLDRAVDGLFLGAAALAAIRLGLLPAWAGALVLVRHALPWLAVTLVYFARAAPPEAEEAVSGRLPGLVLFAGLALALLGLPGAVPLVTAGALGGLATFAATLARVPAPARPARAAAAGSETSARTGGRRLI